MKPSDHWTINECKFDHLEQHRLGEPAFEAKYDMKLVELASESARRSRHLRLQYAGVVSPLCAGGNVSTFDLMLANLTKKGRPEVRRPPL